MNCPRGIEEDIKFLPEEKLKISYFQQILATCISYSILIQAGVNLSFSAVLLPQLGASVSRNEASWIASLVAISLPAGSLIMGPIIDRFGRKRTCLLSNVPYLAGWTLMLVNFGIWGLYLGRILTGFGAGLTMASLVYVSEITHPAIRGMMLSLNSVFVSFGILLTCVLGFWLKWQTMIVMFIIQLLLNSMALSIIPESPQWLVIFKNDEPAAKQSLKWLYKNELIVQDQLQLLVNSKLGPVTENNDETFIDIYTKPEIYKPFVILLIIFFFQQITGAYVVIFYALDIFEMITGSDGGDLNHLTALVLLGTIRFSLSIVSSLISKQLGRRPIFFVSSVGMILTSLIGAIMCDVPTVPPYMVIASILGYVSFSSLGYLVLPWTLIGELLSVKVKGVLGGVLISYAYILMFATVKGFPFLVNAVTFNVLFYWLFAINIAGLIFIFKFLPETLGKNFRDIENIFKIA